MAIAGSLGRISDRGDRGVGRVPSVAAGRAGGRRGQCAARARGSGVSFSAVLEVALAGTQRSAPPDAFFQDAVMPRDEALDTETTAIVIAADAELEPDATTGQDAEPVSAHLPVA